MFVLRLVIVLALVGVAVCMGGYLLTGRPWYRRAGLRLAYVAGATVLAPLLLLVAERLLLPIV